MPEAGEESGAELGSCAEGCLEQQGVLLGRRKSGDEGGEPVRGGHRLDGLSAVGRCDGEQVLRDAQEVREDSLRPGQLGQPGGDGWLRFALVLLFVIVRELPDGDGSRPAQVQRAKIPSRELGAEPGEQSELEGGLEIPLAAVLGAQGYRWAS